MSDGEDGMRDGEMRYDEHEADEMPDAIREEGPAGRGGFDPTPYLRQLRGRGGQGQEYLDVKWRLLWLRREHPDAEIVTEHVRIDDNIAIFKATVTLPSGGKATGYGSETAGDFGDFIEKAETKAVGRALNALGYGAQFSERADDEGAPPPPRSQALPARPAPPASASAPVARPETPGAAEPAASAPSEAPTLQEPPAPVPFRPAAERGPAPSARTGPAAPAPPEGPGRRARGDDQAAGGRGPRPVPAPSPSPARPEATSSADDVDMADVSWSDFWAWARKLGYRRKDEIESFLGRPVNDLTPGEVRALIRERRGDA